MAITLKPTLKNAIAIPAFIFVACWCITLTAKFKVNQSLLSTAIIFDLLITAPLAYYLVIRKTNIAKTTIARVFIIGLLMAGFILNSQSNQLLHFIKTWISPFIEATVIFFIGRRFYTANKKAKLVGNNRIDFLPHCRMMMQQILGNEKVGNIIASEIAVLYYAFVGRKDKTINYQTKFTCYKGNGILLVLNTFMCLFLIETVGMHFLFTLWNKTIAWIFTGLSGYTCLQLFAHIKAVKARPTMINNHSLEIHNGLAGDAYIDFCNIEKFELNNKLPENKDAIKIALIKGLENHNCIIYLKQPIEVTKIFGIKKTTSTVLFFVDEPKQFALNLEQMLKNIH